MNCDLNHDLRPSDMPFCPRCGARSNSARPTVSDAARASWIGWNKPESRSWLTRLGDGIQLNNPITLTPLVAQTLYTLLARYHDLEDMGYSRDWDGIAAYCPRTDDEAAYDDLDPDHDYCERCGNMGYINCFCGGDLCVCHYNGEIPCPSCGGI